MKFLVYAAVSVNVTSNFLFHVLLAAVNLVSCSCPKVYQALNPWEGIPTQIHILQLSGSWQECHAFGFAFNGIWISGELEVVGCSKLFTCLQDVLQGRQRWCHHPVVITITEVASVVSPNPAPRMSTTKSFKQFLTIHAISNCCQNFSLATRAFQKTLCSFIC